MHKILIIDDEKDICFLIAEILKDENYITSHALNSDEALIKFNEFNPDLIILDVWLSNSNLDGIELLKEFKITKPDVNLTLFEMSVDVNHDIKGIDMAIKDKNNILSFTLSVDSCNLKSFLDLIGVDIFFKAAFTSFES